MGTSTSWIVVEGATVEQVARQAGAGEVDHVHEIPLAVAKLVVGYRFDSEDDDELEYVTLVAPQASEPAGTKRWWQFW